MFLSGDLLAIKLVQNLFINNYFFEKKSLKQTKWYMLCSSWSLSLHSKTPLPSLINLFIK